MSWIKVLGRDALPQDARQVVKVGKHSILLLHHEGEIYAVDNICPHMRLPLERTSSRSKASRWGFLC